MWYTVHMLATELVTDDHLNLVKNENYWDGDVNVDEITVRTISDGDTLGAGTSVRGDQCGIWYGICKLSDF